VKIWVVKVFGREILRTESHQEPTVAEFVRGMIAHRIAAQAQEDADEEEGLIECECCGTMFDPAEDEDQDEVDEKFEEIAGNNLNWGERMVWDARAPDDEDET
jgi:hypothetical protein